MKLAWLTDTHLNFLRDPDEWWAGVCVSGSYDGFVITGDITSADRLDETLEILAVEKKPVWFVLGNHDYYGGSIVEVRRRMAGLSTLPHGEHMKWLGNEGVVRLTQKSVMVGDDGWYDGRNGDYKRSDVNLNDFYMIRELMGLTKPHRLRAIQALADESASRLGGLCRDAVALPGLEHLYVATHVPPFAGAAWHMGQPSDEFFQPFFSNRSVGHAIKEATDEFRKAGGRVMVLCGHSHSEGEIYPSHGLTVRTGKAIYSKPAIHDVLEIE